MSKCTYYIVLLDGESAIGPEKRIPLPQLGRDGSWIASAWAPDCEGDIVVGDGSCYELTTDVARYIGDWWSNGLKVYQAEPGGETVTVDSVTAARRVRLLRPISRKELADLRVFVDGGTHKIDDGHALVATNTTLEASGTASVRALGHATIYARDNAVVQAHDFVSVFATDDAIVNASYAAVVHAYGRADVEASGSVIVHASGNCCVSAYGHAHLSVLDNVKVEARGHVIVHAFGPAHIDAYAHAIVRVPAHASGRDAPRVKLHDKAILLNQYDSYTRVTGRGVSFA